MSAIGGGWIDWAKMRSKAIHVLTFVVVMTTCKVLGVIPDVPVFGLKWFAEVFLVGLASDGLIASLKEGRAAAMRKVEQ